VTIFEGNRELLLAFRGGDRAALSCVYWHYVDDVERLARLKFSIGAADALSDIIQETFLRAFSPGARQTYDGLRPYRPYLLRIARNLLMDRTRAVGRAPVDPIDAELETLADPGDAPETLLAERELVEATRTWVEQLPGEQQTFVRLRFEQGLSQDDVAVTMGVTRRRVRTLEKRVRALLCDHLRSAGMLPA
jgi:RNA polymerase sigma-70 factor (ECF subfamily)